MLIQELGGIYLESDHFIPECTHLVISKFFVNVQYIFPVAVADNILIIIYNILVLR